MFVQKNMPFSSTLGRRVTTYATYDRPHLRPQKKKKLINKLIINQEVTTQDTHNPGEEAHR
jgi:hypothetical protein